MGPEGHLSPLSLASLHGPSPRSATIRLAVHGSAARLPRRSRSCRRRRRAPACGWRRSPRSRRSLKRYGCQASVRRGARPVPADPALRANSVGRTSHGSRKRSLYSRVLDRLGCDVAFTKLQIRGNQCRLCPIFDPQLFHDASDVNLDGAFANR